MIEQMEQFSSRLGELSRVESTHEHTAQGLEQGARHRDEQLRSTSYTPHTLTLLTGCTNRSRYKQSESIVVSPCNWVKVIL